MTQLPSRERLEALASGNAFTCVQDDEAAAMASALLAAHEQEPVSGTTIQPVSDLYAITVPGCEGEYFTTDAAEASRCVNKGLSVCEYVKLERLQAAYTHPAPVPEVPDEMTIRDACKFVQDMRIFDDVTVIVMRTWNACRAAMLNGGKS